MGSLDLVADCLADIMQESAALGKHDITFEFCRHESRKMRHLDGVREHILPVTRTVAHAPEETHKLGMNAVDARLERRLLPRLLDALIDFASRLLNHLLDARGMNASVLNQLFERNACNLAAHGVKARKDDRLRCIVDDEVDARQCFEGADVAPLTPNDAPFHLIVRQCHNGYRRLCHMIGSTTLDCNAQDLTRCLVRLILRLLDVLLDLACFLVFQLLLSLCHEDGTRLLRRQTGDALKLLLLTLVERRDLCLCLVDPRLLAREPLFLLLDGFQLAVEIFLLLDCAALETLYLAAALLRVTLKLLSLTLDLLLRLEQSFLLLCLRLLACLLDDALRLVFG